MPHDQLETLAKSKRWTDLEQQWLSAIGESGADPKRLLPVVDVVVQSGQGKLAETMGWAWLSSIKETNPPADALQIGRELLVRLPDGGDLREEILALYEQAYQGQPGLQRWIERSGLREGKSVRRAMRYLDVGLKLGEGVYLRHRSDDLAARIVAIDVDAESVSVETARGTKELSLDEVIGDYDVADEHDFQVLQQLRPNVVRELAEKDPIALAIGILRCHNNEIDRDTLKLLLVPAYVPQDKWSDWWTRIRSGVKKSANLRIEGRSPMFLIYDPVGQSAEDEAWMAFKDASRPKAWLDIFETYLRDAKQRGHASSPDFVKRLRTALSKQLDTFKKHNEPAEAFATAIVLRRIAAEIGEVDASAVELLRSANDPVSLATALDDVRFWVLLIPCVEEAMAERSAELLSELILFAPVSQCDALAKRVEKLGGGELLPLIAERALSDPGRYTKAIMWLWKGPNIKTELPLPSRLEMLTLLLNLTGPQRMFEGRVSGQTLLEMRSKVRAGLSARDYEVYRTCLKEIDMALAAPIRRQLDRAEGLGPNVQSDMITVLRAMFPHLHVKPTVLPWDDESVLYFSHAGLKIRQAELDELVNVKMRENAKAIGEAASRGDLSENSEYKFALEERDLLRARVAQINKELSLARPIEQDEVPTDHVSIGQHITLVPTTGGEPIRVSVMGVGDSDINARVYAYQTPIARTLLGKKIGDTATLTLTGEETLYRIDQIEVAV